jgi:hypothetical protein
MLLWGNLNYNYNEASMGYLGSSNFQYGIFTNRGWTNPTLLTYAESHDEERLMFKNEQYGNSNASYNVKDINTGLKRQEMVAAFLLPVPGPKMVWQFGELGFDYSINRCEDGTIDNSCRLSPKPIVWNYYGNANRKALYDVYSKLIRMRTTNPAYLSTFTSSNITYDLSGGFKWIRISEPALRLMIVGNFDIVVQTGTVTFPSSGTWYSYLTGSTIIATGAPQAITLQPGEYYVYTSANVILPLSLTAFNGIRQTGGVKLSWTTTAEVNLKNFELQRSENGADFTTVYTAAATGNGSAQQQTYDYLDNSDVALTAQKPLYYRLKTNDKDGKTAWSKTLLIAGSKNDLAVLLYPNPITTSTVNVQLAGGLQGKTEFQIQDVSGRVYSRQYVSNNSLSTNTYKLNVAGLANGTYWLKVINNSSSTVKSFTVQH